MRTTTDTTMAQDPGLVTSPNRHICTSSLASVGRFLLPVARFINRFVSLDCHPSNYHYPHQYLLLSMNLKLTMELNTLCVIVKGSAAYDPARINQTPIANTRKGSSYLKIDI